MMPEISFESQIGLFFSFFRVVYTVILFGMEKGIILGFCLRKLFKKLA